MMGKEVLSHCSACAKPWDMYRGKRRCSTCGVPLLICKDCHSQDRKKGTTKKLKNARCDLCIKESKSLNKNTSCECTRCSVVE